MEPPPGFTHLPVSHLMVRAAEGGCQLASPSFDQVCRQFGRQKMSAGIGSCGARHQA